MIAIQGSSAPRSQPIKGAHSGILALIIVYGLLALIYSLVTPPFEAPDESYHFGMAQFIARTGQLPVQDAAKPDTPYFQEGSQPPLYYLVAAALLQLVPDALPAYTPAPNPHAAIGIGLATNNQNIYVADHPVPISNAIHLLRLWSVFLGAVTVWAIFRSASIVLENRSHALFAAAFVAFNPMFLFIHGSLNNDTLVTTIAALVTWRLLTRFSRPTWNSPETIGLALLLVGGVLSKLSGAGLYILALGTLIILALQKRMTVRRLLLEAGLYLIVFAIGAGWWFFRNLALYGDWTGTATMIAIIGPRLQPLAWFGLLNEMEGLRVSSWALFGWLNVIGPAWFLLAMDLWTALAMVGGVLGVVRIVQIGAWRNLDRIGLLGAQFTLFFVALIAWTRLTPGTQGRLLFPALTAVSILTVFGWFALTAQVQRQIRAVVRTIPYVVLIAIAITSPWATIAPAYALPRPVSVPSLSEPNIRALKSTFGAIEMVAYRINQQQGARTVGILPDADFLLTFFAKATQPIHERLSLYVTIYDCNHEVIGKLDTYPGGGDFPTDRWVPEQVYEDSYRIPLSRFAADLCQPLIETGWYDFATRTYLVDSQTGKQSLTFRAGLLVQPSRPTVEPEVHQAAVFSGAIRLIGYSLGARQVQPGSVLPVNLVFEGSALMREDFTVLLHLESPDQSIIIPADGPPRNGDYPTSSWIPGIRFQDAHQIVIPQDVPPGIYQIIVGFYRPRDLTRLPIDGSTANYVVLGSTVEVRPVVRTASPAYPDKPSIR